MKYIAARPPLGANEAVFTNILELQVNEWKHLFSAPPH